MALRALSLLEAPVRQAWRSLPARVLRSMLLALVVLAGAEVGARRLATLPPLPSFFPLGNPYAEEAPALLAPEPGLAAARGASPGADAGPGPRVMRIQTGRHELCVVPKPPATLRIVMLGGSAVYGYPLTELVALPHLTEQWLAGSLPRGWQVEALNLGEPGTDSEHEVKVLEQALEALEPDIVVLWTGNNEFNRLRVHKAAFGSFASRANRARRLLQQSVLFRLMAVRLAGGGSAPAQGGAAVSPSAGPRPQRDRASWEAFRRSVVDPDDRALVSVLYSEHLDAMAEACRRAGAHLVLGAVPVNLAWSSEHDCAGGAPDPAWQPGLREVAAAMDARLQARDGAGALEVLRSLPPASGSPQAVPGTLRTSPDPEHAWLLLRQGQALRLLGDSARARAMLERAADRDPHPVRALPSWAGLVRWKARLAGAAFVDGPGVCAALCDDGIADDRLFSDHCHTRAAVTCALARALAVAIVERGWLPAGAGAVPRELVGPAPGAPGSPAAAPAEGRGLLALESWPGLDELLRVPSVGLVGLPALPMGSSPGSLDGRGGQAASLPGPSAPPGLSALPVEGLRRLAATCDVEERVRRWQELLPLPGSATEGVSGVSAEALCLAGHDLYSVKRYAGAAACYAAASRLRPEDALLAANEGHAAWAAGDWARARRCYARSLALGGRAPWVARRLDLLEGR